MPDYWCKCSKCDGKLVGKTTWYAHNPGNRKRRRKNHSREDTHLAITRIQRDLDDEFDAGEDADLRESVKRARPDSVSDNLIYIVYVH